MSELRKDPLTGDWAIIAQNRAERPIEFHPPAYERDHHYQCPFCSGFENETPPAIREYREQDDQPWIVRVVPNKYPALTNGKAEVDLPVSFASDESLSTVFQGERAVGANEIVIESARHVTSFSELDDNELQYTMQAFIDATNRCVADPRSLSVSLFKNCRFEAGASIEHTHSQIISLPVVTSALQRRMDLCREFKTRHDKVLQQTIIENELKQEDRIVEVQGELVAYTPYASRMPYQTCISYLGWPPEFHELNATQTSDLAKLIRKTVKSIETALHEPAYNLIIQLAPFRLEGNDFYHWQVEILPRVTRPAGLEWSTECWINPVAPEDAARHLRELV